MDSEEEYYLEEISKLKDDVEKEGLGLIVFGEWYNVDTMVKMKFFDDNTRSWWTPVTGVHALLNLWSMCMLVIGNALKYPSPPLPPRMGSLPAHPDAILVALRASSNATNTFMCFMCAQKDIYARYRCL